MPEYYDLTITSSGSLTCNPYNPAIGTGGVLVFNVSNNFTVEQGGKCDVSGKGFLSGQGGNGGAGGSAGIGGLAGTIGQNGGNTGVQQNTGINGGGNGGSYGGSGALGGNAITSFGISSPAINGSLLSAQPPRIVLGNGEIS